MRRLIAAVMVVVALAASPAVAAGRSGPDVAGRAAVHAVNGTIARASQQVDWDVRVFLARMAF